MEESSGQLAPLAEYALWWFASSTLLSMVGAYLAFLKNRPARMWAGMIFLFIFPFFILIFLPRDDW